MHKPSNTLQQVKEWLEKRSRFPFETMKKWDALYYIQQLETRLAQVERERDLLVGGLEQSCDTCKHRENMSFHVPCNTCSHIYRFNAAERGDTDNWEWRGVCAENTKEE